MIKYSAIEKKQTDWAIDKLMSCKNVFELLILDLFQFFTLKDLVGMYKIIKKKSPCNDNCAIIK